MSFIFCPHCGHGQDIVTTETLGDVKCEKCGESSKYWRWLAKTNEIRGGKEEVKIEVSPPPKPTETPSNLSVRRPIYKDYFPLGVGKGINVTVWPNNISLQRQEKDESGRWKVIQEIALAKTILERLFIRLPKFFDLMQEKKT